MILIVTALQCEAKPLINHFNLKREKTPGRFSIYSNPEICLVVSGTGMLKCAVAAASAITFKGNTIIRGAINAGICGSLSRSVECGTAILPNKIVNKVTQRVYYPDILFSHSLMEGTLYSFPHPAAENGTDSCDAEFVDMEAAGFMEASLSFLPPQSIHCLKVVSDYLEGRKLDQEYVSGIMENNILNLESVINSIKSIDAGNKEILSPDDYRMLELIAENLKLSVAMRHQFRDMAAGFIIRTGGRLDCIKPFTEIKVKSRFEGKKAFAEIGRLLGY